MLMKCDRNLIPVFFAAEVLNETIGSQCPSVYGQREPSFGLGGRLKGEGGLSRQGKITTVDDSRAMGD